MEAIIIVPAVVLGLPWLVFHYITKWKQAKQITPEDEELLDLLYDTARRLDDRLDTIERILDADQPGWKQSMLTDQRDVLAERLADRSRRIPRLEK